MFFCSAKVHWKCCEALLFLLEKPWKFMSFYKRQKFNERSLYYQFFNEIVKGAFKPFEIQYENANSKHKITRLCCE
jgi:hypothetical protein